MKRKVKEAMSLREILETLAEKKTPVLLCDSRNKKWEAGDLLRNLSASMLNKKAHIQAGLYIAEISDAGYLGGVLFRFQKK